MVSPPWSGDGEADRQPSAGDAAVDGERRESVGLEVAQEKPDREVRGHSRTQGADEGLAANAVALLAEQLRELQQARGADDRRREEEREARGLLIGEARDQATSHARAGARESGDQRQRL